mmetsp:Transcript_20980/g.35194  ORF Transcript_20980/g.35194 Transcript_20980/m.35194 type:complete len:272 (+) Transcript_20980:182-997(+)|eukprot:CAMPEP_0198198726 /NCGR_PEP_ID=MMETSP1445-20131203/2140_1 /TAXON_ID=36898 /ORGANISM="Pyramimonas sp., Strain CCMP2087" /LENGTH=271 /DNA_ID=CAMNT_0043868359 /DNA_START=182 /DNA_END=997 /DNA_ORIENTATION=-
MAFALFSSRLPVGREQFPTSATANPPDARGTRRSNSSLRACFGVSSKRCGGRLHLRRKCASVQNQLSDPPLKVLRDSLRTGDDRGLKRLFDSDPSKLDVKHGPGRNATFEAAEAGHHHVLHLLLKAGANPDAQNGYGRTALMEAAKNGHVECIQVLAKHNCDLNVQNKNTWTAALYAAKGGHAAALCALAEVGADMSIPFKDGSTVALLAAGGGHYEAFAALIHMGVDLTAVRTFDGKTAMQLHFQNVDGELQRMQIKDDEEWEGLGDWVV